MCKNCAARLDEPRVLQCGHNICSYCYSNTEIINSKTNNNKKEFQCPSCGKLHEIPEDGLPINKTLVELLSMPTIEVSRGKQCDTLKSYLTQIQTSHKLLNYCLNNPNDFLKEHFINMRSKIQLATDQLLTNVNDCNELLIEMIDQAEKGSRDVDLDCMKYMQEFSKKLEYFTTETNDYLDHTHKLDNDKIEQMNKTAFQLMSKLTSELEILNRFLLNNRNLDFENCSKKLKPNLIGNILHGEISKILTDYQRNFTCNCDDHNFTYLNQICEFNKDTEWNLIYRGSEDGYKANDFHNKCDYKANTLVLIEANINCNSYFFGGYTEQSWESDGMVDNFRKPDLNAFIFSLSPINHKFSFKAKSSENMGICCCEYVGPMFESNLIIGSPSNLCKNRWNRICDQYKIPAEKSKSSLVGKDNFRLHEIEVFTRKI